MRASEGKIFSVMENALPRLFWSELPLMRSGVLSDVTLRLPGTKPVFNTLGSIPSKIDPMNLSNSTHNSRAREKTYCSQVNHKSMESITEAQTWKRPPHFREKNHREPKEEKQLSRISQQWNEDGAALFSPFLCTIFQPQMNHFVFIEV